MLPDNSLINKVTDFLKITDIKLAVVLAGWIRDKSIEAKLKEEIRGPCRTKLFHLGFVSGNEKYTFLNSIDLGLVFYEYEKGKLAEINAGASVKVGEYLAFGLPVIYPKWWEYEEYYKEIGLSYEDGDELIERIKQLSCDLDLRQRLGKKSKELFNERLNFENESSSLRELISLYL